MLCLSLNVSTVPWNLICFLVLVRHFFFSPVSVPFLFSFCSGLFISLRTSHSCVFVVHVIASHLHDLKAADLYHARRECEEELKKIENKEGEVK